MIRERVETPVIVDADTGYGNALNVSARCGCSNAPARPRSRSRIRTFPKRCGHLADKALVPAAEMVGKIKAAVDARASADTLIIARTDAVAVEGFDARHRARAARYAEAGADVLFVEAPRSASSSARSRGAGRVRRR